MYNLLLVDDERPILDGLYSNIPWEDCGFTGVYQADNAQTALEMIARYRIDIMVTDISMPGMDGLELCERLREAWPLCRIVLLTGYRDFEYARRAVDLGVYQYLVKPVRYEDLLKIVRAALEEMQRELEQSRMLEQAQEKLRKMGALVQERVLSGWLLRGDVDPTIDAEDARAAGLDVSGESHGFSMAVRWHGCQRSAAVMQLGVSEMAEQIFPGSRKLLSVQMNKNEMLLAFLCSNLAQAQDFFEKCVKRLDIFQISVQKSADCLLSLAVSQVASIAQMHDATMDMMRAFRQIAPSEGAVCLPDGDEGAPALPNDVSLRQAVSELDLAKTQHWTHVCAESLRRQPQNKDLRRRMATMLLAEITADALGRGLVFDEMQSICTQLFSPSLLSAEPDEAARLCLDCAAQYIEYVRSRQNTQRSRLVDSVRQIISEQMECGITVNSIAEQLHYSSNYLSHLIKDETGLSLEETLISMRMDRACRLLKRGMRVQEVAISVGYDNLAHFSRLFKRKIGVSPRQYVG